MPFFQLSTLDRSTDEVVDEQILANPFIEEEKTKGIKVAEWLLENSIDILLTNQDQSGKGPAFVLGNGGASILLTSETDAGKL